jgi:hypothetical protein
MSRWIVLCSCLLSSAAAFGQVEESPGVAQLCPVPIGSDGGWPLLGRLQGPHFRDTALGARPHPGPLSAPAHGYEHYDLPSRHYGMWYRPSAFAESVNSHCEARRFAPRGTGWANRLDPLQMDYHPYLVKELPSVHGPSYYHRPPVEPCPCRLQGCCNKGALVR